MTTYAVNEALTTVRLQIIKHRDNFYESGYEKLLAICEVMRDFLMKEDIAGFDWYVDTTMAREVDAMDILLDELFATLNINTREELSAILAAD